MSTVPALIQGIGQFALLVIGVCCGVMFLISILDSHPRPRNPNKKRNLEKKRR